jgi:2-phosphosulfolactate phosphatase
MTAYFDQGQFDLCCEWGMGGVEQLAPADVIIIIDILSFTTSVDVALGRGATILPYRWNDGSAIEYARERNAELASPRHRREGMYSLSPASLISAPRGLRLVLPSPNGSSLTFAAMSRGAVVLAGCLRNASAVAARARQTGTRIIVVPAGERWPDGTLRPAFEDWVGAGAILKALPGRRSPEAQAAVAAFEDAAGELRDRLFLCSSGRELTECGFGRDVELAAELDISSVVPILQGDAFVSL